MKDKKYQKILNKVKGLLAIAEDHNNDEESQSAFLLAQKLIANYNIEKADYIEYGISRDKSDEISVTTRKRLFWWERELSGIIAYNFRVKHFYRGSGNRTKIMFFGFERDLEVAKEMFILAYETVLFHSKEYIKEYYDRNNWDRERWLTMELKRNYIAGYLSGLSDGFRRQVAELKKEYDLMVLIPKEIEDEYKAMSKNWSNVSLKTPSLNNIEAYQSGFKQGKKIDFTRSTVGMEDYSFLVGRHIVGEFSPWYQGKNFIAKVLEITEHNELKILMQMTLQTNSLILLILFPWITDLQILKNQAGLNMN